MDKMTGEFKRFYMMALELLLPNSSETAYQKIVDKAIAMARGKYGSIFLPKNGRMERVFTTYPSLNLIIPAKDGIIAKTYGNPRSLITQVTKSQPDLRKLGIKTVVAIPLIYDGKSLGVLSVLCDKEMVYSEKMLLLFDVLGLVSSLAIIKNRQLQKLEKFIVIQDLFLSVSAKEAKLPQNQTDSKKQSTRSDVFKKIQVEPELAEVLGSEVSRLKRLMNDYLSI